MRIRHLRACMLPALLLTAAACSDSGPTNPTADIGGSFARIQREIFDVSCTSCHSAGTSTAQQSGLILTADVAYRNLVGTTPQNANAAADGMKRVTAGNPEQSLLYHKLQASEEHHSGHDYGSPMPLGAEPLFNGQLDFVRRWITAGAPRNGEVADTALLLDRTRPSSAPFEPLIAPATGFQLRVEPFTIQPNFERELFVLRRVGNTEPIYINRVQTRMRAGSHHLAIQTFRANTPPFVMPAPNVIRDIRNSDGSMNFANMAPMGFHVFFAGAMSPSSDYNLPPDVALRLPANAVLDLNSHYVNLTNTPRSGEVYVNLHTVPAAQVVHVARTLDMANLDIVLPPKQRTTLRQTFLVDSTRTVVMLTSHMHQLGERFVVRIAGGPRNGEVVYSTSDWQHPEVKTFSPPLVLQAGQGLTSEITWNNTTSQTVRFGLTSRDEMGIIFGYYY